MTTRTPVQYNSSGAAAGFGPQAHPPHEDAAAAKLFRTRLKVTLITMVITELLYLN